MKYVGWTERREGVSSLSTSAHGHLGGVIDRGQRMSLLPLSFLLLCLLLSFWKAVVGMLTNLKCNIVQRLGLGHSLRHSVASTTRRAQDLERKHLFTTGIHLLHLSTSSSPPPLLSVHHFGEHDRQTISTMSVKEARKLMMDLDKELLRHDDLYYNKHNPEIEDFEYDRMVGLIISIEETFEALRGKSEKLRRVGAPSNSNSKLKPFQHSTKMLSLDNAFNHADLQRFCYRVLREMWRGGGDGDSDCDSDQEMKTENTSFILESKIDGLSLALHYMDGNLIRAGTRGDGTVGEDVTDTVLQMDESVIPRVIALSSWPQCRHLIQAQSKGHGIPRHLEVRGEVYIPTDSFISINQKRLEDGMTLYSTARNAAAGNLRRIHTSEGVDHTKSLKFFAYALQYSDEVDGDNALMEYKTFDQAEVLSILNDMGFKSVDVLSSVPLQADKNGSIPGDLYGGFIAEQLLTECKAVYAARGDMDYNADGVVIKVNSHKIQSKLGSGIRAPKWGIAYKFPVQEKNTTLLDIKVQVGRTGVLTPVGILHPITLGGVVIERVTLHNQDEINRLRLRIGKKVRIIRSGDVIPKVLGCVENDYDNSNRVDDNSCFSLPSTCPVCGSASMKETIENGTSVVVRCSGGLTCSAQLIEGIRHYCSRDAVDIKGLGLRIVEQLHELGKVTTLADLYKLKKYDDALTDDSMTKLQNMKGWGEKSVNVLFDSIEARRKIPFYRFLYAIGIRGVGKETAKAIAVEFNTFDAFWKYLLEYDTITSNNGELQTSRLHKFSSKAVEELLAVRRNEAYSKLVDDLLEEVEILDETEKNYQDSLDSELLLLEDRNTEVYGKSIVFSGKLQHSTRKAAEELCRKLGGIPLTSVTKGTSLVVSSGTRESNKLKKAEKLGIKIIDEDEWIKLSGGGGF